MKDGRDNTCFGFDDQFRLVRLQTFNWGTFNGVFNIPIPEVGFLFVGPSGSGKSTLLDVHAALMTPPRWIDFNVAAREAERTGKDRNVLSYVRGAWAKQTGDTGEHVVQYLRTGTTWSAVAETYRDTRGRTVVLAQVLWVRGTSASASDVKRLYIVINRAFELAELEFFAESDFNVRRFKQALPDAFVRDEFAPYQERFRSLLGIDNERALRLLHKTQSAKNLGDLNTFLREFMLDTPKTFKLAEQLVSEFGELDAAHQAVVAAREQIETLAPARTSHADMEAAHDQRLVLDELAAGIDGFREQKRAALLRQRIGELGVAVEGAMLEADKFSELLAREFDVLCELKSKRHGLGGGLLEQLTQQLERAQAEQPLRVHKRDQLVRACQTMSWEAPDTAASFVRCVALAKQRVLEAGELAAEVEREKDGLKESRRDKEVEFQAQRTEIDAMERQRSNIPARMLQVRAQMARALGIAEEALPFAGELLDVRQDAAVWRGVIERVLHSFAQSLLVDERHYSAVSAYLNETHLGERLVYFRTVPHVNERRAPGSSSLIRKLAYAPSPHADWLRAELAAHFDYDCAESLQAFRNAQRAVTREGQVKHGALRHEKDDRRRVDDRSRWVLGFDNKEKLALYKQKAGELGAEIAALSEELSRLAEQDGRRHKELLDCQTLSNLSWTEVDVGSLLVQIESLRARIDQETRARPELAELDTQIVAQDSVHKRTQEAADRARVHGRSLQDQRARQERALDRITPELLSIALTPIQQAGLDARFASVGRAVSLDTLDSVNLEVDRSIKDDQNRISLRIAERRNEIERCFADFNRRWPADGGGLDSTLASASDYFGKLLRLETDGLPRHEERFIRLLHDQSDQNLTLLASRLEQERSQIRARLELVNESLLGAAFNPGTHLEIETQDKTIEDVRQFKQTLRQALSHSFSAERELAERRFEVLRGLVTRLKSQDTADRNWRNLVLDVRQHVEFLARELDADQREVEVYSSGEGKSGGQRQKLAATCLAAALRYQLGGQDRGVPSFSTVVLDEAFDKADAEFTTMAMNIFKSFGFQMIVATPLKSVMTLEPFIGGACFVHIRDRKTSAIVPIEYDEATKRLKLPEAAGDSDEAPVS
jgi:uncharacterized protein YPO0396